MTGAASDESFRAIFEPHRRPITAHCYRMLGSLQDAEEIVQETLLRAWQRQDEARPDTTRPWLYKIATNACLDHLLKARRRRVLPQLVAPSSSASVKLAAATDERLWIEPAPDALLDVEDDASQRPDQRVPLRESIGLAFITAFQSSSPKQRAALLLVDVLEWRPEEAATLLETSLFSVNSLLQRARKSIVAARIESTPTRLSSADTALLQRFIHTWESGDTEAFTALLTDDALFSMPPQPEWFRGQRIDRPFLRSHVVGTAGPAPPAHAGSEQRPRGGGLSSDNAERAVRARRNHATPYRRRAYLRDHSLRLAQALPAVRPSRAASRRVLSLVCSACCGTARTGLRARANQRALVRIRRGDDDGSAPLPVPPTHPKRRRRRHGVQAG